MFDFEKRLVQPKAPGFMVLKDYEIDHETYDAIPLAKALGYAWPKQAIETHCRDFFTLEGRLVVNHLDYVRLAMGMHPYATEARMV